ncbi:MAG: outer membrane beta-barrel protein [Bacteroidota bacterium]|nr:outer membrane beta-barrel protein [Bacteroidota bacterium]
MKKMVLLILILFQINIVLAQNDSIPFVVIDSIQIQMDTSLKLTPIDGKYEVYTKGTLFEEAENVWEGLKQVPMLKVSDEQQVKVMNKTAMVEINGIETQMSGADLEEYLKSLDPSTIRKIVITSNPDASYETGVHAVVNIELDRRGDNYRLGLYTKNGVRSKYYNDSGINYSVNGKKISLYTNYNYSNSPVQSTSHIRQQIEGYEPIEVDYKGDSKAVSHQGFVNMMINVSEKSTIDLTSMFRYADVDTEGTSLDSNYRRDVLMEHQNKNWRLAQVFKHKFNDSVNIKLGSYQVFRDSESLQYAKSNQLNSEYQQINTEIPIIIGFADYSNKNKLGLTMFGARYNNTKMETVNNQSNKDNPFSYTEHIFSLYANHTFTLSDTKTLGVGIRTESTAVVFEYKNLLQGTQYKDRLKYTNLLYNIHYNWYNVDSERTHSLAFRKQIRRPNYAYLNPFKSIDQGIIYSAGDYSLTTQKTYSVSYESYKSAWGYYLGAYYIKDFVSNFFDTDQGNIVRTYQNFDHFYLGNIGVEYNNSFYDDFYTNKTTVEFSYFKIQDSKYEFRKSTPSVAFSTTNIFKLNKKIRLNVNYNLSIPYYDGVILHYQNHQLDLSLNYRINKNFNINFYVHDLFKTDINQLETTVSGYFYGAKDYHDTRSVGIQLRWSIKGERYKSRDIEEPTGNEIDRL